MLQPQVLSAAAAEVRDRRAAEVRGRRAAEAQVLLGKAARCRERASVRSAPPALFPGCNPC